MVDACLAGVGGFLAESRSGRKALDAHKRLLPNVLRHYGQALRRGGKYAPQALPRLLSLWLEGADLLSKCEQEAEGAKLLEPMEALMRSTVPAKPKA